MNAKKTWARLITLIMAVMMVLSLPMGAFAADTSQEQSQGTQDSAADTNSASAGNTESQYKTGLYKVDGVWKYFENGKFKAATGLVKRPDTGNWYYVEKGVYSQRTTITKKVQNDGRWYFVYNGAFKKATGLAKRHDNGKWYYIENGVYKQRTTITRKIVKNGDTNWYFVYNGGYKKATGLARRHDTGDWYYIQNGKFVRKTTLTKKIVKNGDNNWYYVKNGKYTKSTGLAKRADTGKWYYVRNGKYTKYTGVVSQNGSNYYVHNGGLKSTLNYSKREADSSRYGTAIVIHIDDQKLDYVENGLIKLTTDVVTGNRGSHNTPTGTYSVRAKQRGVTLTGSDYASYVSYWMPFIGQSYGIHDASWRSYFGGSIYRGNGSHGCVNVPYSNMVKLWGMVSVGTPVIIKY